jgi:hypothetical protein
MVQCWYLSQGQIWVRMINKDRGVKKGSCDYLIPYVLVRLRIFALVNDEEDAIVYGSIR